MDMKEIFKIYVSFGLCLMLNMLNAQNHETVKSVLITSNPDKSYYVNFEGRILSTNSIGVRITGSVLSFFLKVNPELAGGPSSSINFVREENFYDPVTSDQQIQSLAELWRTP